MTLMKRILAGFLLAFAAHTYAAVTTLQVTIGAATTQVSTTPIYCTWVVFQDNATHNMYIGDVNTSSSRGLQLLPGGGSFYQGPLPTGGATNLADWYVAGTQNEVLNVVCRMVNF
jgi:hypothetical protein